VNARWPVADAVQQLETIYVVPITYEGIQHIDDNELTVDERGRQIIKSVSLSFTYEPPPEDATLEVRKALAKDAIAEVLKNYAALRGANVLTIVPTNAGFDVIPVDVQPLLDTRIFIAPGEREPNQLGKEIGDQLSVATGRKITAERGLPRRHVMTISATNESARSVLHRMVEGMPMGYETLPNAAGGTKLIPTSISWMLVCGPLGDCGISFRTVAPKGRGVAGMAEPSPAQIQRDNAAIRKLQTPP
jgi:hypothetical protein